MCRPGVRTWLGGRESHPWLLKKPKIAPDFEQRLSSQRFGASRFFRRLSPIGRRFRAFGPQ